MTPELLIHTFFSFLPFMVCLFWFICFAVNIRRDNVPKLYFTVYIATCTVLYLCHALFFTIGLTQEMECLWTLCSLSVYPLFYAYLTRLTTANFRLLHLLTLLLPGAAVALAKYLLPDAGIDRVRLLLFAIQIICVCYLGIRRLKNFDAKLQTVYADTERRDTTSVHHLLVAIIIVSIISGIANSVGKHLFGTSLWLLVAISSAFSVLLFSLSYICFNRVFTIDNLRLDEDNSQSTPQTPLPGEEVESIGNKINELMTVRHYFTKKDLKISDLATEIGTNRTYISNYINRTYQCSFSDMVNKLRIEYAQQLIKSSAKGTKITQIADESGFASEQSFYRNFKKFTGMTPAEWQKDYNQ